MNSNLRKRPANKREEKKYGLESNYEELSKPLIADDNEIDYNYNDRESSDLAKIGNYESYNEEKAWNVSFTQILAHWAAWFGHVFYGAGFLLNHVGASVLRFAIFRPQLLSLPELIPTPEEKNNLSLLKDRLQVPFNSSNEEHGAALAVLWNLSFPFERLSGMVSEQWKEMGWQGKNPATDFRGGGFISLENLIYFAKKYPTTYRQLLHKEKGLRSDFEYPFAVAGLNITFMLINILDLKSEIPNSLTGRKFVHMLGENMNAFDELFCACFVLLDDEWLSRKASYMEFNSVLNVVQENIKSQILLSSTHSVFDVPCHKLLVS